MGEKCDACNGRLEEDFISDYASMAVDQRPCRTCQGTGVVTRTGPYRLADGTWSDGVDRSKRIDTRKVSARFEVTIGKYSSHVWHEAHQTKEFDKWAEAIAYADRMARTNQGENK